MLGWLAAHRIHHLRRTTATIDIASNDTAQGKAENRRVSVNILVSKGLDGM